MPKNQTGDDDRDGIMDAPGLANYDTKPSPDYVLSEGDGLPGDHRADPTGTAAQHGHWAPMPSFNQTRSPHMPKTSKADDPSQVADRVASSAADTAEAPGQASEESTQLFDPSQPAEGGISSAADPAEGSGPASG